MSLHCNNSCQYCHSNLATKMLFKTTANNKADSESTTAQQVISIVSSSEYSDGKSEESTTQESVADFVFPKNLSGLLISSKKKE